MVIDYLNYWGVIIMITVKHILIDCTHLSAVRKGISEELFEILDSRNIIAICFY